MDMSHKSLVFSTGHTPELLSHPTGEAENEAAMS